eukprot:COSAG05_NODE_1702_length_4249_cov_136.320607_3_plen_242_part_00
MGSKSVTLPAEREKKREGVKKQSPESQLTDACFACVWCLSLSLSSVPRYFRAALMSWGDFASVASWRGPDGILTQLEDTSSGQQHSGAELATPAGDSGAATGAGGGGQGLGAFVSQSKRRTVREWISMLRRRWQATTEPEPEPEHATGEAGSSTTAQASAVAAWGEEGAPFFTALAALETAAIESLTMAEQNMVAASVDDERDVGEMAEDDHEPEMLGPKGDGPGTARSAIDGFLFDDLYT